MNQKNQNLLVVDDEAAMRGLLHDFFSSLGYKVHCYGTAEAALKYLQAGKPTSAVIADIRMNPMNGMELLRNLKREYPTLPVVLFTSAGNPEQRDEALRAGALGYFTKPFSLTELKQIIDQAIAEKNLAKKSIA